MRVLILTAVVLGGALPLLADARADFGTAAAHAVETAVATAIPGARITWDPSMTITLADGAASSVITAGRIELSRTAGPFYLMELEFPQFASEAAAAVRAFPSEPPARVHPTDLLVAMQTTATGEVTAMKSGRLDPTAVMIDTRNFRIVEDNQSDPWPAISVTYWGTYGAPDWYGSVRWSAVFDTATMANNARLPLAVTKTRKVGDAVADMVAVSRLSADVVRLEAGMAETTVDYPCPFPCFFDGRTLLASW